MLETKLTPAEEFGRRVDEALRALNLPDDITRWTSQPHTDWQGDSLVRVVFVLQEDISDTPRFRDLSRKWDLAISDALREALPEYWPILIYRSLSDQELIDRSYAVAVNRARPKSGWRI